MVTTLGNRRYIEADIEAEPRVNMGYRVLADQITDDEIQPLGDDQERNAARTICANAENPEDARMLLDMLGISMETLGKAPEQQSA